MAISLENEELKEDFLDQLRLSVGANLISRYFLGELPKSAFIKLMQSVVLKPQTEEKTALEKKLRL